jgi:hypothetical protein
LQRIHGCNRTTRSPPLPGQRSAVAHRVYQQTEVSDYCVRRGSPPAHPPAHTQADLRPNAIGDASCVGDYVRWVG